jgi:hypothetical protein
MFNFITYFTMAQCLLNVTMGNNITLSSYGRDTMIHQPEKYFSTSPQQIDTSPMKLS